MYNNFMIKKVYLKKDNRDGTTYDEFVKTIFWFKNKEIIIKKILLYDPAIKKYRKQKVYLSVKNTSKKIIKVEVVKWQ